MCFLSYQRFKTNKKASTIFGCHGQPVKPKQTNNTKSKKGKSKRLFSIESIITSSNAAKDKKKLVKCKKRQNKAKTREATKKGGVSKYQNSGIRKSYRSHILTDRLTITGHAKSYIKEKYLEKVCCLNDTESSHSSDTNINQRRSKKISGNSTIDRDEADGAKSIKHNYCRSKVEASRQLAV